MIDETFDYVQYLDVKKSIDDRSLNQNVWKHFSSWLKKESNQKDKLKLLEIGAGIGTMIERLLEAGLLRNCHYIALEPEDSFKEAASSRLESWANQHAYDFIANDVGLWEIQNNDIQITVEWLKADADQVNKLFDNESFDLILSHAVIDLLPVPKIMPVILEKLKKQGGFYFSLNFAGETVFFPAYENDSIIAEKYHADMDKRFPGLDWQPSKTGGSLGGWLDNYGCQQIVEGASDWELASVDHLFIKNILDTINKALDGLPDLEEWIKTRYLELDKGVLKLSISNRDCFGLK
jgi:hypothetical protein